MNASIFPWQYRDSESWIVPQSQQEKSRVRELNCYRKVLRIPRTKKVKGADILKDLNI